MSKPDLGVIVPYHNEDMGFFLDTIKSIKETIDVPYEIICVDDHSNVPLTIEEENVKVVRQQTHLGVGQAFNLGVKEAQSDNLFLMGSDVRFLKNNWASKMIGELDNYPTAFTCSTCIGLNQESPEGMDIEQRQHRSRRNGASILMFWDHQSHPKMPHNFRSILQCQWLPVYRGESKESFEVPAILGAAYGVKKAWYNFTEPWIFHRSWGALEPEVSLRSWFFGGSCRTAPDILTGHVFKRSGTHGTPNSHVLHNRIQLATLMFNDHHKDRLLNFIKNDALHSQAMRIYKEKEKEILSKREEYEDKIVVDASEWCKRWGIDFRE